MQSDDLMSRHSVCIHAQFLLTPTAYIHYLSCPNRLETCVNLAKSVL